MKLLLDECLPVDFRHCFPGYDAQTVQWAGLKGKTNGELMLAAENAGYDVLLTVDQGLPRQQKSIVPRLAVVLIRGRTNQLEDLRVLIPAILLALETIQPGQKITVGDAG